MYNLFLDDERVPERVTWLKDYPDVFWTIVRNLEEFEQVVNARGLPENLSLDHDLDIGHYAVGAAYFKDVPAAYDEFARVKEYTGWHCMSWFCHYCETHGWPELPTIYYHTLNHVGKENMMRLAEEYNERRKRHLAESD